MQPQFTRIQEMYPLFEKILSYNSCNDHAPNTIILGFKAKNRIHQLPSIQNRGKNLFEKTGQIQTSCPKGE